MNNSVHTKFTAVSAFAAAAATSAAILWHSPATAVAADTTTHAATKRSMQLDTMRAPVLAPLVIPEPHRLLNGDSILDDVVQGAQGILGTALSNPGRLVTIQPTSSQLAFRTLPAAVQTKLNEQYGADAAARYETVVAAYLEAVLKHVDAQASVPLTVAGLPIEGSASSGVSAAETNDRFANVIHRLDALTSSRSFLMQNSAANERSYLQLNLSEALRLHNGRPIIFRTNNIWRMATFTNVSTPMVSVGANFLALSDEVNSAGGASDWDDFNELQPPAHDGAHTVARGKAEPNNSNDTSDTDSKKTTTDRQGRTGGGGGSNASFGGGGSSGGSSGGGSGGGGGGSGGDSGGASGSGSDVSRSLTSVVGSTGSGSWLPDDEADANGAEPFFGEPGPIDVWPNDGGSTGGGSFRPSTGLLPGAADYSSGGFVPDSQPGDGGGNPGDGNPGGGGGDVEFAVIVPGNGFSGPTNQPSSVGSQWMAGYNATVIARWDVVPYQTFTGEFHVGVVAFHMNGVHRVDFSANGGPWTSVYDKQLNPRTDVWEYTAVLRSSDFNSAGPVEIRAIVWPDVAGRPRVLGGNLEDNTLKQTGNHSLVLNVDPDGSLLANRVVKYVSPTGNNSTGDGSAANPYASIWHAGRQIQLAQGKADNGVIYLMAGDHEWAGAGSWQNPVTEGAWITVTAAPGLDRSQVRISSGSGQRLNASLTHLKNVTVRTTLSQSTNLNRPPRLWFENCVLEGAGPTNDRVFASLTAWTGGIYSTETTLRNVRNGFKGGTLIERNERRLNLGEDAFFNCPLIINAYVDGINTAGVPGGPHPDIAQYSNVRNNNIIYGLQAFNCQSQGVFMRSISSTPSKDIAFVNIVIEMDPNVYLNQILNSVDHLLLWHVSMVNRPLRLDHDPAGQTGATVLTNVSMRHNVFHNLIGSQLVEGQKVDHNHFIVGSSVGTNPTTGSPQFMNPAGRNYKPGPNSPLRDRLQQALAAVDAMGELVPENGSIGALQP